MTLTVRLCDATGLRLYVDNIDFCLPDEHGSFRRKLSDPHHCAGGYRGGSAVYRRQSLL